MYKKKIVAAGGVVVNEKKQILFIYRRSHWDLPKGKLDEDESIEACAVREVKEETGLKNVAIKKFLGTTSHEYYDKWLKEDVLKETWWYQMDGLSTDKLIPQTSEDIEQIIWADDIILDKCLLTTYPSILEIITVYEKQMK